MRLYAKIFLCATLVLCLAVLFSGYLLITNSFENAVLREIDRGTTQHQYSKFSVQSGLLRITEKGVFTPDEATMRKLAYESGVLSAFFSEAGDLIYSDIPGHDLYLPENINSGLAVHKFIETEGKRYLSTWGKIEQSGIFLYLMTCQDISAITDQKKLMVQSFERVYFTTLGLMLIVVLVLSAFLTRPINKLTKAATRIAGGRYNERIISRGNDEISMLSQSFNVMAEAIEEKIEELSDNAKQKEDFVASFAHELKTPLTSVIGYADMIYQKELSPQAVKDAAWYILTEGMRLEALSLKLMDLIVLNRQSFILEEISPKELFDNIVGSLKPLFDEKSIICHSDIKAGTKEINLRIEYDLFKTLILNLVDNSIKAGSTEIWISGMQVEDRFHISISDNGRGMPESELNRITEAFYMVDKSRSRKQHGAGLGLSLAAKIAEIHGSKLNFSSVENIGTIAELDVAFHFVYTQD